MKLAAKGLLIVSVPVISQVILVITMSVLVFRANNLAIQQANTKAILSDCNQIIQTALDCVQREFAKDDFSSPLTTNDIVHLREQVSSLKQKLSEEKQQTQDFQQLSKISNEFIPFLIAVKDHRLETSANPFKSEKLLFAKLDETTSLLGAIINSVNTIHRSDPEENVKARTALRLAVLAFIVINVILTLVLAYFASVSIRKPLVLMAKNADRISSRRALAPPMTGSDEIANLDSMLHQVDQSIHEALTSERNLITYAGHLICSIDKNGLFQQVNPFSTELLGYAPENLLGKSVLKLVTNSDADKVDQLFGESVRVDTRTLLDVQMRKQSGELIDTVWSAAWSEIDESLFCIIHDVTEQKRIEQIKQDFLAMISHDLRTPLMSVHSSVELIRSGSMGFVAPQAQNQLDGANRNAEHLIGLINDLLDFEKLEAGRMNFDPSIVPLERAFVESLNLVQALIDETGVRVEPQSRNLSVNCDEHKLVQVIVNLLSNAMKHSPPRGVIRLIATKIGDMIEISVHDEGPGVPEEYRHSIFAPFEQITERETAKLGTGLGLAICKLIVEGQGGTIGVRSSNQLCGSAFTFTLPGCNDQV